MISRRFIIPASATAIDLQIEDTMKNPLDSLGATVFLGFVLTVVMVFLIRAIA